MDGMHVVHTVQYISDIKTKFPIKKYIKFHISIVENYQLNKFKLKVLTFAIFKNAESLIKKKTFMNFLHIKCVANNFCKKKLSKYALFLGNHKMNFKKENNNFSGIKCNKKFGFQVIFLPIDYF